MSDLDVKIQDVANYWDYNMPMMAMEELAEAIQAISKVERANDVYIRAENTNEPKVADAAWRIVERRMDELKDEIRDVYISLKALMYRYNIENDIMERVEEKLNKKYKED
jgi:NTP pyrophosphatase (non-canonical NTP hydrolase)